MALLLSDAELQRHFFTPINDVFVFKNQDFRFFLEQTQIDNSYTRFANRIGLSSNQKLFSENSEVVLDFPFKDCVLAGGQSSEEGLDEAFSFDKQTGKFNQTQQKRKEIFFNQVLAFDEIDRLLDPKAFKHAKRINANGENMATKLNRNENGEITDNLIIKGNNLIALHTLATQFRGKVKLIYIDPPYYFIKKKADDSFAYNSNFKLSTWLVFMKNRLEIAKELLPDDGVIFISISDDGQAHLKLLLDEIFGRDNFIGSIPRLTSAQRPSQEKYFSVNHDYLLVAAKNKNYTFNSVIERDPTQEVLRDHIGCFFKNDTSPILASATQGYSEGGDYDIEVNGKIYKPVNKKGIRRRWLWTKKRMLKAIELGIVVETKTSLRVRNYIDKEFQVGTNEMVDKNTNLSMTTFDLMTSKFVNNIATDEVDELDIDDFNFPKPESLIEVIIKLATQENDIILDFHLGSGTTAAVAHKMKRQYIGIEQMDYIETIALERMKKVIAGEQGGISKAVNWQGGGELVYCELATLNETAKQQILATKNVENLTALFAEICQRYFLKYNVNVKDFANNILPSDEFKALDLNEQKSMMLAMLDLNQLYLSYSDMTDEESGLSEGEQAFSRSFYGESK